MSNVSQSDTVISQNDLICPYCGKHYPLTKRNAYRQHVWRHKRAANATNDNANTKFRDKAVAANSDSAGSVTDGGASTDVVESPKVGPVDAAPAELAEIPPVGTVEGAGAAGQAEEKRGFIGARNFGGILIGLFSFLFRKKGAPDLSADEKRALADAFADENLNIPTSPRVAALANVASAIAGPLVARYEYLRKSEAPKAEPENAPAEGPEPTPAPAPAQTQPSRPMTYEERLAEAQRIYLEQVKKESGAA